ncbi:hypothetical protein [Mycobacteroides abscessus]|uniref:hypothetical protein n=1 Tax=Mycobacteroides abscessus TaxID=36809 RepID=UPI0018786A96|nr:hypothetical protein [Mycobacteroides abscessus]
MNVGDHVQVGSLWAVRPWGTQRPGRRATGVIERFTSLGVVVRLDELINGRDWCTASPAELTVIA